MTSKLLFTMCALLLVANNVSAEPSAENRPQTTEVQEQDHCQERVQMWKERACYTLPADVALACSFSLWCIFTPENRKACKSFPRWWRKCC